MDYFEKKKSGDLEKMKLQKSVEKGRKRNRKKCFFTMIDER